MVKRTFITLCLMAVGLTLAAQETLNIYTVTADTISITFDQHPQLTFETENVLTIETDQLTVQFPFADIAKITLNDKDNQTAIGELKETNNGGPIFVYDLTGKLIKRASSTDNSANLNLSDLRTGIYIIKDGKRTYKVRIP